MNITQLDINSSCLVAFPIDELLALLSTMQDSSITHLGLCFNNFHRLSGEALTQIAATLSTLNLTSLDWHFNLLHKKTSHELKSFFLAFKDSGITSLNLSHNRFCRRPIAELIEIITVFNELSITQLNLAHNELQLMPNEHLRAFFAVFPKHMTLILSASEVKQRRPIITSYLADTNRLLLIDKKYQIINPNRYPQYYRDLGIKTFVPSLKELTTFFMANNSQVSREGLTEDLEESLTTYELHEGLYSP